MITSKMIMELLKSRIPDTSESFEDTIKKIKTDLESLYNSESSMYYVLGIDIYRYSKFEPLPQAIIPFVFKSLFDNTIKNVLDNEKSFFKNIDEDIFESRFISTGDGGFLMLDNPLQCLIVSVYFQSNLSAYNTINSSIPFLFLFTEEIYLRYTITGGNLFKYEKQWYGSAIINNARIISKDKLNRFLIDRKSKLWFDTRFNGIESLQLLNNGDIKKIKNHKTFFNDGVGSKSNIIPKNTKDANRFKRIDLSKIEEINVKREEFEIYNLHLQIELHKNDKSVMYKYLITLGNLNMHGLNLE